MIEIIFKTTYNYIDLYDQLSQQYKYINRVNIEHLYTIINNSYKLTNLSVLNRMLDINLIQDEDKIISYYENISSETIINSNMLNEYLCNKFTIFDFIPHKVLMHNNNTMSVFLNDTLLLMERDTL